MYKINLGIKRKVYEKIVLVVSNHHQLESLPTDAKKENVLPGWPI